MKSKIAVVFALVCLTTVNCGLVGGWEKIASDSAEVTEVLESFWPQVTDYLVNTTGRPFHHKLMQIAKVKTQVVAGMKYRYTFDIAPTKCPITDELTKEQVNQCGLDETEVSSLVFFFFSTQLLIANIYRLFDDVPSPFSFKIGWIIDKF